MTKTTETLSEALVTLGITHEAVGCDSGLRVWTGPRGEFIGVFGVDAGWEKLKELRHLAANQRSQGEH